MSYNKKDLELVKQYKQNNMSNKTILAIINKQSDVKYTENDIVEMLNAKPETNKFASNDSKLYDIAAGFVFNAQKRKKAKRIALIILAAFLAAMITLVFIGLWKVSAIIVGSIIGLCLLIYITFQILLYTGVLSKIMEKHGL